MDKALKSQLIEYLKEFVTPNRWQTLNEVLDNRTRYLTVVLEDIYQPHNASAVLRSCDCFGIQNVHIIENKNEFDPSKGVTIGADQWLSLHTFNQKGQDNTSGCYRHLREQGYTIIATTPHQEDITIDEIPLDKKTALVFGAEYTGLSEVALEQADAYAKIPMAGFSESFNISVGAAICLYELSTRLRKSEAAWPLSEREKTELLLEWLKKSIRASDKITEKFMEKAGH